MENYSFDWGTLSPKAQPGQMQALSIIFPSFQIAHHRRLSVDIVLEKVQVWPVMNQLWSCVILFDLFIVTFLPAT